MQITLCWPCTQLSNAEHSKPKNYKHLLFLNLPRLPPCCLDITSSQKDPTLTLIPFSSCLNLHCIPLLALFVLILFSCIIATLPHFLLQMLYFLNHINMPCMYKYSPSLILKLFLSCDILGPAQAQPITILKKSYCKVLLY